MDPFAPMLANNAPVRNVDTLVAYDDWAFEPKIDGHRRVIMRVDGIVTGYSRKGEPAALPGRVAAEFARLQFDVVLDGELIGDVWACFDLLMINDVPTFGQPYWKRRDALERLFAAWSPGVAVQLVTSARSIDDKAALLARVKAQRAEGIMAKDVHAGYHPARRKDDRSDRWVKLKLTKTVDCAVLFFGQDRQNMSIGVYHDTVQVNVGEVSRLTGDGPLITFVCFLRYWLRLLGADVPEVVVEVTCLYCSREYKLIQPVTPRLRVDKGADECTFDQLEAIVPREPVI